MAGGWTRDGAVQDQIDDTVKDAILRARALTPQGESAEECDDCGEPIPKKRREALPGVRTCIACQFCLSGMADGAFGCAINPASYRELATAVFREMACTGITTVGDVLDLLEKGETAVMSIRNFGEKSLDELRQKMREKGYMKDETSTAE